MMRMGDILVREAGRDRNLLECERMSLVRLMGSQRLLDADGWKEVEKIGDTRMHHNLLISRWRARASNAVFISIESVPYPVSMVVTVDC
jgi:hypothetical protein